jgi:eukaryotic-like serine/threonine-protein kinase
VDLSEDELRPGLILGRYELLAPVAKGGMAQVWIARMTGTRGFTKTVAIKTMLPNISEDPLFEEMFLDEASLASRVRHPNAVEIMDLGEDAGILYLVMEWIDGEPLSVLIKQTATSGGIPRHLAVRIVMQSCAGLHAAHELKDEQGASVGLVHRDVSPQNILTSYDGVVKVVDFGVAKATGRASAATSAGQLKGKVPYMSPEQASGGEIDRRTDVFAMGILLYMMTTGKHPFRKENEAQTLLAICSDAPVVKPSSFLPDYPPELETVLLKSLAKSAEDRFQTASEMQRALDALPGELRASTDDELAEFVREVLAERMEKRRSLIQRAIQAADHRAEGRKSLVEFLPEERTGQTGQHLTPLSGVTHPSSLGAPLTNPTGTAHRLTDPTGATLSSTSLTRAKAPRSRIPAILGGLLLGVGVGLAVYLPIVASRSGQAAPTSAPGATDTTAGALGASDRVEPAAHEPPRAPEVVQVTDLRAAEDEDPLVVEEIDFDELEATSEKARAPHVKARSATPQAGATPPSPSPGATAPGPAPAPGPAQAPAPAPKPSKPFISPFANPDF